MRRLNRSRLLVLTAIAMLAVVVGGGLLLFRLAQDVVPTYRGELEARLSERIDQPVSIERMSLVWRDWLPTLSLREVSVLSDDSARVRLHFDRVGLGFSPWRALWGEFVPARVVLVGPSLTVARTPDGGIRVYGLEDRDRPNAPSGAEWTDALDGLALVNRLVVRDARVRWRDPAHPRLSGVFREVDILLAHSGSGALTGTLSARPPEALGEDLRGAFEVEGLEGDATALTLRAEFRVADVPAMPWLGPYLNPGVELHSGLDSLRVNVVVDRGRLQRLSAEARADRLLASVGSAPPEPVVTDVHASGVWQPISDGWRLDVTGLQLDTPVGRPVALEAALTRAAGTATGSPTFDLAVPRMSLGMLRPWLDLLRLPGPDWLHRLEPTGRLRELNLTWPADAPGDWIAAGRFSGLDTNPVARAPGVAGLSGRFRFDAVGGRARLRSRGGLVRAPEVFDRPLPVSAFDAHLAWSRADSGWLIEGERVEIAAVEARATGTFTLDLADGVPPVIDLKADFSGDDVVQLKPFVPAVLPDKVESWLDDAVTAGRVTDGHLILRGALRDFPFVGHPGEFKVNARVHDASLAYADDWPALSDVQGRLDFHGLSMTAQVESASIMGEGIGPATAEIADFRDAVVQVEGEAEVGLADQLAFLATSPLRERYRGLLESIDAEGPAALKLSLTLPLKELDRSQASGAIVLRGDRMVYSGWPKPLTDIEGVIRFGPDGLTAEDVQVRMDGLAFSADLSPMKGADDSTRLVATTQLSLPRDRPAVAPYVPAFILDRVSGTSPWRLALTLSSSADPVEVVLSSDLVGTRIDFPAPLAKAPDEARPVQVEVVPGEDGTLDVRVEHDRRLSAALALSRNKEVWRLAQGLIRMGGAAAILPGRPGLWVEGRVAQADVPGWLAFVRSLGGGGGADTVEPLFHGGELFADRVSGFGQRWQNVSLVLDRKDDGWRLLVESPDAAGVIDIRPPWATPDPADRRTRVNAEMSRMRLSVASLTQPEEASEPGQPPLDPAALPVVFLRCGDCRLNGLELGAVTMDLAPLPGGLALKTLSVNGAEITASASGRWTRTDGISTAELDARLDTGQLQELVKALGYAPNIKARESTFNAGLSWTPAASGLGLRNLVGSLTFTLQDGALLAVDPGAGRVLGLLNFYALPRRFLLNFRDVTSKGLIFDTIEGGFEFRGGVAYTARFVLESPALRMTMDGSTGLVDRTYDQTVTVYPEVGSSVPIAGAVLGGPAVGAFLLIAQQLLQKPLSQLSQFQYHLGGTWDDPRISEVE